MSIKRFEATIAKSGPRTFILIPFDADDAWGVRERHYVSGSIGDDRIRGCLDFEGTRRVLPLGPAWVRDHDVKEGDNVEVALAPDGHQVDTIAPDIAAALNAEPQAKSFFESVAPFYRNNYIRSIEGAKRPETRSKRIAEMVSMLKAGTRQW